MAERVAAHDQGVPGRPPQHRPLRRVRRGDASWSTRESPGSGEVFDWRLAEGVVRPGPAHRVGRPHADNVADAIAHLHPFGVDVSTGVESAPGRKDPARLRAFVVAAARPRRGSSRRTARPASTPTDDADELGGRALRLAGGASLRARAGLMGDARSTSGRFGDFGGRFVPESLMPACHELEAAFRAAWADPAFHAELDAILRDYGGRPTPVTECRRLSERLGVRVLLKREDLAHTGSHKLNNVIGQALLALRMGKRRLIAETGAGQHGVATATAAALFGLECVVYMGEVDTERQALNVFRMELLGAEVRPVEPGAAP